jgi:hypothetical protein
MRELTWRDMAKTEPRLQKLYADIRMVKDDKTRATFCANSVWYGYAGHTSFKERMSCLVGFQAANPALRTMDVYDAAYQKLYDTLPNCRNCGCL